MRDKKSETGGGRRKKKREMLGGPRRAVRGGEGRVLRKGSGGGGSCARWSNKNHTTNTIHNNKRQTTTRNNKHTAKHTPTPIIHTNTNHNTTLHRQKWIGQKWFGQNWIGQKWIAQSRPLPAAPWMDHNGSPGWVGSSEGSWRREQRSREAPCRGVEGCQSEVTSSPSKGEVDSLPEFSRTSRKRVARAEELIAKATEQKSAFVLEVQEAEERVQQLEAEAAKPTPPSAPTVTEPFWLKAILLTRVDLFVLALLCFLFVPVKTTLNASQGISGCSRRMGSDVSSHGIVARRRTQQGVGPGQHIPAMPTMVPGELSQWLEDRQEDLKDAFAREDDVGVLELTSKMAQGAERLIQLTRQPGTTDDELVLRGAPGEGRFAPY